MATTVAVVTTSTTTPGHVRTAPVMTATTALLIAP